jgi:hypothetical protein
MNFVVENSNKLPKNGPTLVLVDPNNTHNLMFETFESRVYAHCNGSF